MRSRWEVLHTELLRSLDGSWSTRRFVDLQARFPVLEGFAQPIDVVQYVAQEDELDGRDLILRPLVYATSDRRFRPLAQTIVMICLWSGLDALFRRRLALFRDPDHLATEIVDSFTLALHRIDLGRVACLTATLVRNTERELLEARARERSRGRTTPEEPEQIEAIAPVSGNTSVFGLPDDLTTSGTLTGLRTWLERNVGSDAELVLQATILERSRSEIAAALGITSAAARKRLERALVRARHAFVAESESQNAASVRPS
ncbi:MAG TPA: hypothetical protein VKZ18_09935 [Polyangia bacterium]|nr:hypothetical protein [Polyangia bacterium]